MHFKQCFRSRLLDRCQLAAFNAIFGIANQKTTMEFCTITKKFI